MFIAEKLRHLHQLLPDTFVLPSRPGVDGKETGEGKPDGLPDRTSEAPPVIEEDMRH